MKKTFSKQMTTREKILAYQKKWYMMWHELGKSLPPEQKSKEKFNKWNIESPKTK